MAELQVSGRSAGRLIPSPRSPILPLAGALMRFDDASQRVVKYLKGAIPLGFWSVTRYDGERQVYLTVEDSSYGLAAGGSHLWSDSMCQRMVDDGAPQMAPDVEVIPAYRTAGVRKVHTIGAYVGVPIQRADGGLFGALCGLDPSAQSNDLRQHEPLLELLCTLLSGILELDTQRSKAQSRLERSQLEAETDILTGLLNRRGWDQAQAQEEERHHRFGDPGAVLVVDLDGLKIINDTMGHAAGDEHLRLAAQTLREVMRPGDSVARLGGDEFAVLVMGVTSSEMGSVASRMQAALDRIGVSASFGYAMFTAAATFNGVFALADKAMYAQKHGRSRRTPA